MPRLPDESKVILIGISAAPASPAAFVAKCRLPSLSAPSLS